MAEYAAASPPPSPYQEFMAIRRMPLPHLTTAADAQRRAEQIASGRGSDADAIGFAIDFTFGERGEVDGGPAGHMLRKVVPSGGSRHPTEVFVVAFEADGIESGVHHYNVRRRSLDLLRAGHVEDRFADLTFDLLPRLRTRPAVALVLAPLLSRAMWRYREPRSWRSIPIDVGHAVGCLVAVLDALGRPHVEADKFRDRNLAAFIGVDPLVQTPMAVLAVGRNA
jgi:SagB-type dehydrogenase family enzyme